MTDVLKEENGLNFFYYAQSIAGVLGIELDTLAISLKIKGVQYFNKQHLTGVMTEFFREINALNAMHVNIMKM